MGNSCTNVVTVDGAPEALKEFLDLVGRDFDFNKIIPTVDDSREAADMAWGCRTTAIDAEFSCDDEISEGEIGDNVSEMEWVFFTSNNAPDKIYEELVRRFPDIYICWRYEERGNRIYGYFNVG